MAWHHEMSKASAAAEQTWFEFNHQIEVGLSSIGSYQDMRMVSGFWLGAQSVPRHELETDKQELSHNIRSVPHGTCKIVSMPHFSIILFIFGYHRDFTSVLLLAIDEIAVF